MPMKNPRKMSRKAVAVLSLSAIAFFIAIIMLSHDVIRLAPGPKVDYLAQTEVKMFNTYLLGEEQRLYIDMAAKYAYDEAGGKAKIKENKDEFTKAFSEDFAKRLESFSRVYWKGEKVISLGDYAISIDEKSVKGIAEKAIAIRTDYYAYSFKPSFKVIPTEEVPEAAPLEEPMETCTAAIGACMTECDAKRGESVVPEAVCPKTSGGIAQYCCRMPAVSSAACRGEGGNCQDGCGFNEEPLDINCGTGKRCCRPKAETVPLLPPCAGMGGTCRLGPGTGETLYAEASCERPNEYCFVGGAQNECESNGNECKALSCEHPSLAAEYISIHIYDESCGTGRFCCKKR